MRWRSPGPCLEWATSTDKARWGGNKWRSGALIQGYGILFLRQAFEFLPWIQGWPSTYSLRACRGPQDENGAWNSCLWRLPIFPFAWARKEIGEILPGTTISYLGCPLPSYFGFLMHGEDKDQVGADQTTPCLHWTSNKILTGCILVDEVVPRVWWLGRWHGPLKIKFFQKKT